MLRALMVMAPIALLLTGCGESEPAESLLTDSVSQAPAPNYDIPMTNLQTLTMGRYTVQPMYEEDLSDGHFNIRITGGEVAAVREWVGPEDAAGVVVVKTEIENDYHHGHVEMPDPIPADARLWIEIETPQGERLKGSVPLMQ